LQVTHETLANVVWSLAVLGHKDMALYQDAMTWAARQWRQQKQHVTLVQVCL